MLVVAEKYQTGFDQPLLHTMYVDKKLDRRQGRADAVAAQPHPPRQGRHLRPRLRATTPRTSSEAFEPFYETSWTEPTDPNLLYNLQTRIEDHHIIDPEEQQKAVTAFLLGNSATHATVSAKSTRPSYARATCPTMN